MDESYGLPLKALIVEMEEDIHVNHHRLPGNMSIKKNELPLTDNGERVSRTKLEPVVAPTSRKVISSQQKLRNTDTQEMGSLEAAEKGESFYTYEQGVDVRGEGIKSGSESSTVNTDYSGTGTSSSEDGVSTVIYMIGSSDGSEEVSVGGEGASSGSYSVGTRSTDYFSGSGILSSREEVSSMTNTTGSSENAKEMRLQVYDALKYGSNQTVKRCEERKVMAAAWRDFEKTWAAHAAITEEEIRNGYRLFREVDARYLGFCPRANDKRRFLNAYPITAAVPEDSLCCSMSLPVTFGQWSIFVGFFVFFIGFGAGAYFLLSRRAMVS